MEQQTHHGINVIKFISAILITTIHLFPLQKVSIYLQAALMHGVARYGVPFFFVVSGYFLSKNVKNDKDGRKGYLMYAYKNAKLYLLWSLIYLPPKFLLLYRNKSGVWEKIVSFLKEMVFDSSYVHLWYIKATMGACIFLYFLAKYLSTRKIFILSGFLYVIGSIGNVYYMVLPESMKAIYERYFEVFKTTRNGLFFGMFFISMGIYIKNYLDAKNYQMNYLLFSLIGFILEAGFFIYGDGFHEYDMYLTLGPLVFFLFIRIKNWNIKMKEVTSKFFREASTYIYLLHMWAYYIVGYLFYLKLRATEGVRIVEYFKFMHQGDYILEIFILTIVACTLYGWMVLQKKEAKKKKKTSSPKGVLTMSKKDYLLYRSQGKDVVFYYAPGKGITNPEENEVDRILIEAIAVRIVN